MFHTMIRVSDLTKSLDFYCSALGMTLFAKRSYPAGEFTLAFVGYGDPRQQAALELTYNWTNHGEYEHGTAFGHVAIGVSDLDGMCKNLRDQGVTIVRDPGPMGEGRVHIAFVEDPDGYKLELIESETYDSLFEPEGTDR